MIEKILFENLPLEIKYKYFYILIIQIYRVFYASSNGSYQPARNNAN